VIAASQDHTDEFPIVQDRAEESCRT